MSKANAHLQEMAALVEGLCLGQLTPEKTDRLDILVRGDKACRRYYIYAMHLHATLPRFFENHAPSPDWVEARSPLLGFLGDCWDQGAGLFGRVTPMTLALVALIVPAVLALLAIAIVPLYSGRVPEEKLLAGMQAVAHVSTTADCVWADPTSAVYGGTYLGAGQPLQLAEGLVEIGFVSGATVILEGPVTFVPQSASGGLLAAGRLTARVPRGAEGFTVETPSLRVIDLGTEFGVAHYAGGETDVCVFDGEVKAQLGKEGDTEGSMIRLRENEAARMKVQQGRVLTVSRDEDLFKKFVRRMPLKRVFSQGDAAHLASSAPTQRIHLSLFNTGMRIEEGQTDPHWRITAASNDPTFAPRPAEVSHSLRGWLANDSTKSQWISLIGNQPNLPANVTYTFQYTFDLPEGSLPDTACMQLDFIVDNRVSSIRLNSLEKPVPKHGWGQFDLFHHCLITEGFLVGTNVLEIDVENTAGPEETEGMPGEPNPVGLRVELEGSVKCKVNAIKKGT